MKPFELKMGGQGTVTPKPEWAKWVDDPAFIRAITDAVDAELARRLSNLSLSIGDRTRTE
jgi:hypothetical protein